MITQFDFHFEAMAELQRASEWYREQSDGLEVELLDLDDLRLTEFLRGFHRGARLEIKGVSLAIRRLLLSKFPYVIIVAEKGSRFQVIAACHSSRRPKYWLERLNDE